MLNDPRRLPAPNQFLDRVEAFARDLAYGVSVEDWSPLFSVVRRLNVIDAVEEWNALENRTYIQRFENYKLDKWGKLNYSLPNSSFLVGLEYLSLVREFDEPTVNFKTYRLTPKALALLSKPSQSPKLFISYRHGESSIFALLIEARAKLVNIYNPYLDKNIRAGDLWHEELEERIENCNYFICLIGQSTFHSKSFVKKEIEWALKGPCRVISILHNEITSLDDEILTRFGDTDILMELKRRQFIVVKGTGAQDYEEAVSQLLNAMGYATY